MGGTALLMRSCPHPSGKAGGIMAPRLALLGTGKSGLGHLRRLATIAGHLRGAGARCDLITNAAPEGLSDQDRAAFAGVTLCPRPQMAGALAAERYDLAVLDTLQLPGIGAYPGPAALILRETPPDRLPGFARDDGRPWDLVILPNPPEAWRPALPGGFARRIEAAGWVHRAAGARRPDEPSAGIVVATGGGGTAETRASLYPLLDHVIARARQLAGRRFVIRQALGPRAQGAHLQQADEVFEPGAALNEIFRRADLVISTAGYNSVLELAGTETPALLVAIPRSLDDQAARVRLWGGRLGLGLDPGAPERAAEWLAAQISAPHRRALVPLGPDGGARAAQLIQEALCPVS